MSESTGLLIFWLEAGCEKGDGLAVMADNCSKYLEVYFGAAKIGVRVTPINVRLGDDEIVYIVNDSDTTFFVVGDGYEEKAERLKNRFQNVQTWVTLDNPIPDFLIMKSCSRNHRRQNPIRKNIISRKTTWPFLCIQAERRACPRASCCPTAALSWPAFRRLWPSDSTEDDSTCFVLPIFHVSWWPILAVLLVGGKTCINRKPDLEMVFRLIQDEKCTHMNLVPTIYGWKLGWPNVEKYDFSSLRAADLCRQSLSC